MRPNPFVQGILPEHQNFDKNLFKDKLATDPIVIAIR